MFDIVIRAVQERYIRSEMQFRYVVVLTKIDKVGNRKLLNSLKNEIKNCLQAVIERTNASPEAVKIIDQEGEDDEQDDEKVDDRKEISVEEVERRGDVGSEVSRLKDIEIIQSSTVTKEGTEVIWKYFQETILSPEHNTRSST